MKQKIATLLLLAAVFTTTTFATPIKVNKDNKDNVSHSVLTSFNKQFSQASEVSWSKGEEYIKATFRMNGQLMFAYFTGTGQLMGVSRNLTTAQLPINLQSRVATELSSSWVSELFEFATEDETAYFITLENADVSVTLKGTGATPWFVYKKVKKN